MYNISCPFLLKRLHFTTEHKCGNRVLKFSGVNAVMTLLIVIQIAHV